MTIGIEHELELSGKGCRGEFRSNFFEIQAPDGCRIAAMESGRIVRQISRCVAFDPEFAILVVDLVLGDQFEIATLC